MKELGAQTKAIEGVIENDPNTFEKKFGRTKNISVLYGAADQRETEMRRRRRWWEVAP